MDPAFGNALREALREEIAPLFGELRRFVDRRIAELSAELDAHVQLSDLSEEKLAGELRRVQETVSNLVALPAQRSRNSGIELEQVVLETEAATNRILQAAEEIQGVIDGGALPPEPAAALATAVNTIFEACAFQDVTGQRVRRAIQHLEEVDDALRELMPEGPEPPPRVTVSALKTTLPEAAPAGPDLAQGEIDALFGG
jgi:chemotaxis protein CheZ